MGILFHRELEDKIGKFLGRKEIIIIRGPRQSGKTTLLELISKKIPGEKHLVNLDIASYRRELEDSPIDFVERLKKEHKLTLFLDEVQRVQNGGEKLKIIYDTFKEGVKIFASGSSSLELKKNVLGFLAGRALLFELLTFSFGEFLNAKDRGLYRIFKSKNDSLKAFIEEGGEMARPSWQGEMLDLWKEYVVFGGYPEVVKVKDDEVKAALLRNIFNMYLEKDVISFFKIEDTARFEDFLRALAFNDSAVLNLSSVASDAGVSYYTAREFMGVLSNTYVVSAIRPYSKNMNTAIRKAPKLYFTDTGLRNAILGNTTAFDSREDKGQLAENFVFRELSTMGYSTSYWRTKGGAEMDFIIRQEDGILPVEVKLGGSKNLGKSFYSFIHKYKPERALMITLNEFGMRHVESTVVCSVPIFYL